LACTTPRLRRTKVLLELHSFWSEIFVELALRRDRPPADALAVHVEDVRKILEVLAREVERRVREQDVDECLFRLKGELAPGVGGRLRRDLRRVARDLRPLLALAAPLEQVAERLDVVLVVQKVVPAEQVAGREHGKVLVGRRQDRVRLERRRDFVGLREIHVQALRAELVVVLERQPDRISHRDPCRRGGRHGRRLGGRPDRHRHRDQDSVDASSKR
jgi:hypothetical protein